MRSIETLLLVADLLTLVILSVAQFPASRRTRLAAIVAVLFGAASASRARNGRHQAAHGVTIVGFP
jgi:hypothetical protein